MYPSIGTGFLDPSVLQGPTTWSTTDGSTNSNILSKATSCHLRPANSPRRSPVDMARKINAESQSGHHDAIILADRWYGEISGKSRAGVAKAHRRRTERTTFEHGAEAYREGISCMLIVGHGGRSLSVLR